MRFARVLWLVLWASFFYSISAGCNSILGNEEGQLARPIEEVIDAASETAVADHESPPVGDSATDAAGDGGQNCPFGKKPCLGACVDRVDPNFGCGSAACDPCGTAHASVACGPQNNEVACILTCQAGWADCDGQPANGCETDLSKPETCGACKTACDPISAPLCAAQGSGFACVASCPSDTTKCDLQCVHTDSDADNCNTCGNKCPGTTNGVAKCVNKVCTVQCNQLFHKCGNVCAADTDRTKCGASCRDCTTSAPFQASASSCMNNTCVFQCNQGTFGSQYLDCNGDLNFAQSNGCETNTWNNNFSCGACFHQCLSGGGVDGGPDDAGKLDGSLIGDGALLPPIDEYCCHTSCVPSNQTCF